MFEHPAADERRANALIESVARQLQESYSDFDDSWDRVGQLGSAPATYSGGPVSRNRGHRSLIRDRDEGRFRPYYEDERDLERSRAQMRMLGTFTSVAVGAMQALQVYTVGGEWEIKVEPAVGQEPSERLIAEVQVVLDRILEKNAWMAGLDCELHDASREDGEVLLAGYATPDGLCDLRQINADCLKQPSRTAELNDWLGFDDRTTSWSFGCATLFDERMGRVDHERHAGYHVTFDDGGVNWDYLPSFPQDHGDAELDGKFGHLIKRNSPRYAKRGVSDYWPVLVDLEREDKLHENTSVGAAVLAAIAWIEEMPPNATREQVNSQLTAAMDSISGMLTRKRGGERQVNRMNPGTVIKTSAGRKYTAGPLGQPNSNIWLEVGGAIKRRIGHRWHLPEFMITGDASNANYASTLVSVSPFMQARTADQKGYVQHFRRIFWKALKIAWDYRRFDGLGCRSFAELQRAVVLMIQPPKVATDDKVQQLAELNALYEKRLIDGNEFRVGLGHEPDPTLEGVRATEPVESFGPIPAETPEPAADPATEPDAMPSERSGSGIASEDDGQVKLNGAQVKAAADILQQVAAGTTAEIVANGLLVGIGIEPGLASKMVAASLAQAPKATAAIESQQRGLLASRLLESVGKVRTFDEVRSVLSEARHASSAA